MLVQTLSRPAAAPLIAPLLRLAPSFRTRQRGVRPLSCVTVNLDPTRASSAELKQSAIDRVQECLALDRRGRGGSSRHGEDQAAADADAAVILVSRSLAAWLDDDGFVARLLASAGLARGSPSAVLSVLGAAVDEVPRYDGRVDAFCSSEGVSVLLGRAARVLPRLWRDAAAGARPPQLAFHPPGCARAGPLRVAVPLANTVFSNGRSHACYASRWRTGAGQLPALAERIEKDGQQDVVLPPADMAFEKASATTVASALVPVTPPRRIAAALGNILRQVDVGQPAPASKELEAVIPPLLERRRRSAGHPEAEPPGPIGVWALVLPAGYVERRLPVVEALDWQNYDPADESRLARETAKWMDVFLAGGCQLRRVLSGGGGWGLKQGLLSLDPETSLSTGEHDDMESFMRSFSGDSSAGGVVAPGSYVQFFVESASPAPAVSAAPPRRRWDPSAAPATPTVVLGTPGAAAPGGDLPAAWPGLFGAVSADGVFLSSREGGREEEDEGGDKRPVETKLDAPRSYVISSARFHAEPVS